MMRKVSLLAMACSLSVFALPAPVADASTGLTEPAGTLVPIGTSVTLTSTNFVLRNTKFGTQTCKKITVENAVKENEEAKTGTGTGVQTVETANLGFGTTCEVGGQVATFQEIKASFKSLKTTPGKGTLSFSFKEVTPGSLVCSYSGVNLPATYVANSFTVSLSSVAVNASPASCVSKTPEISADFILETKTGSESNLAVM